MIKKALFGKNLSEITEIVSANGLPAFAAKQITDWLYKKEISDIEEMSNISAANRKKLADNYCVGIEKPVQVSVSSDGTKKYVFQVGNKHFIESVFIPDKERNTLCISSQIGCKMNCLFCATGKQGFSGNLTANQILNQMRSIEEFNSLTNIVFMGMGEPLDNITEVLKAIDILTSSYGYGWSPKRITVSTVGVLAPLKQFLEKSQCNLAISVHAGNSFVRKELVPLEKTQPMQEIMALVKNYDFTHQRRLSIEYILFDQLNDTEEQALLLASMLKQIPCRINLIPYHRIPQVGLMPSSREKIENFQKILMKKGITTTIRRSRGQDIEAACGMLSTKFVNTSN
ncbi:MAG TPA: 23S rRNA (adenine(2503)-C(2))-methyltransferase RlmN [Paludibacteraceae bacterium]|nr:23S rRNA (adenine(2503)-C(2))-methyltransferase RlmN [Paludibacteraceae bacterium]HOH75043.1 23S rRNA (adenine(2503)-C(2))-methyltransferase RlmN [Paludibacteraceae bacterium]HOU26493.1 23S rRNA (adenine(2503)-C(2))-methyltransferase RlmN [Paludibacteraceae bacterium]HPL94306.1 23S rRNA (adenine(2503)-C(2))-methyltransferase RlmN [Paludibacteraceae bacterium]